MFQDLGGDELTLEWKRHSPVIPDFVWPERGLLIEVDEHQHFSSERLASIDA